jgi:hypothetical protein
MMVAVLVLAEVTVAINRLAAVCAAHGYIYIYIYIYPERLFAAGEASGPHRA